MARQFVVQLDNHPGELAQLSRTFAQRGVQIHHAACAGTGPLQCMFVTFTDDDAARDVLPGSAIRSSRASRSWWRSPTSRAASVDVSQKLADAGVMVTGVIQAGSRPGVLEMAFCVDDECRAREALGLHVEDCVGCSS